MAVLDPPLPVRAAALTAGNVRAMRRVATGLLAAMALLFITMHALAPAHPWAGYVAAFAEAAMVGGLADWFAVTALFRHPLGLPIPHTAIIPRNKDRIGDSLAAFLRANFLTPSVVARRMRRLDPAAAAGRWLVAPSAQSRVRESMARFLGDIVEALADERLGGLIKGALIARLRGLDAAPALGQALGAAIAEDRHVPILDSVISGASRLLEANEETIRQLVHERANALLRLTGLDEKIADAVLGGLLKLLGEMAQDPAHPLRARIETWLETLSRDLRDDPAMADKVASWRDMLLANPAVAGWIDRLWRTMRDGVVAGVRNPHAMGEGRIGALMRQAGETLLADAALRALVNRFLRRATVGAVAAYGDGIVRLVSETIRGWDAQTVTERLENAVGRDLQYIRVNGTLVGGLVGLALHALTELL